MKASPLILFLCLGVGTAHAGGFGFAPGAGGGHVGAGGHMGGGHPGGGWHGGGGHGRSTFAPVNGVSDIEPFPMPPQPAPSAPEPEPEPAPADFAPPPGFGLPPPFPPALGPAPVLRPHSGPQILYLRKPKSNRPAVTIVYGSG